MSIWHSPNDGRAPRGRRPAVLAAAVLTAAPVVLVTPPAYAAPPPHDSWRSASPVDAIPFEDSVDTRTATTDAVNPPGMHRFKGHTVWYHVSLADDADVLISTAGTTYLHKVAAYHADGPRQRADEWTLLRGDRGTPDMQSGVLVPMEAGEDYFVGVGSYRTKPAGTLELVMRAPADAVITLDETGDYDPVDGSATVHGTASSNRPVDAYLRLGLRQLVGEWVVSGTRSRQLRQVTEPVSWAMTISADRSFKRGEARVTGGRYWVYDVGVRVARGRFSEDTVVLE